MQIFINSGHYIRLLGIRKKKLIVLVQYFVQEEKQLSVHQKKLYLQLYQENIQHIMMQICIFNTKIQNIN